MENIYKYIQLDAVPVQSVTFATIVCEFKFYTTLYENVCQCLHLVGVFTSYSCFPNQ